LDTFYPFGFLIWFFFFLYLSLRDGGKTSDKDEDIKDYWSDG
jgi:hypothetical protein